MAVLESLFDKVARFQHVNLLKKRLLFTSEFYETLTTPFYRAPPEGCFWLVEIVESLEAATGGFS